MRNEAAFSVLSDVPQPFYHVPSKTHICFWMGLGMTQAQAMMFIANYKELAFINNSTMTAAYNEFKHAYILGAFGDVEWRYRLDNGPVHHFNWLANKLGSKLIEYDANNHFVKRFTLEKCLRVFQDEQILNT